MTKIPSENKWFVQHQGHVEGPLSTEKLLQTLQSVGDSKLEKAFVWKRGLAEWMKASKWNPNEDVTLSNYNNPVYATDSEEKTRAQVISEDIFYRVRVNFVDQPLMNRIELLALIGQQPDVAALSIQDPKTKEWKEVYAFPDLVERLGLTRRSNPRVPILAQFTGSSNKNPNLNARVITISEGGIGFTDHFELKIGDTISGQITSPHFFQPVSIQAEVIYSGLDGYVGFKFTQITDEAKSAVIEYVKKFAKTLIPL